MSAPSYRRNQVEYVLWRLFTWSSHTRSDIPSAFRTRIKKLLDIDRTGPTPRSARGAAPFGFAEAATAGSGNEAAFTAFDVFCLALALDLLDMGFKQSETVFLFRHIRGLLREAFDEIVAHYPPADRRDHRSRDYPKCPAMPGKPALVDPNVYLLVSKVEIRESIPQKPATNAPVILEPKLCFGREELAEVFAKDDPGKVLVLEIGRHARAAPALLEKAPAERRGRRSG